MEYRTGYIKLINGILVAALTGFVILIYSCNGNSDGEPVGTDPILEEVDINYSHISKTLFISASIYDPQGLTDIDSVAFSLFRPDTTSPVDGTLMLSGVLNDTGINGDIIDGDGVFSTLIDSGTVVQYEGRYRVTVQAFDTDGNSSDVGIDTARAESNSPPLLYLLEASSSSSETNIFEKGDTLKFRVRAHDPQGLDDIASINYTIKMPDGEIKSHSSWFLSDSGNYGDEYKGDGIYSVHQPSNSESKSQGLFTFYFVARDIHGALSDTLIVPMRNPGVTVISPNGGDTLRTGSSTTIEWNSAYIDRLNIEIFKSSDISPYVIATNVSPASGEYQWTIPSGMSSSNEYKVKIYDTSKSSRYDLSDNYFAIQQ